MGVAVCCDRACVNMPKSQNHVQFIKVVSGKIKVVALTSQKYKLRSCGELTGSFFLYITCNQYSAVCALPQIPDRVINKFVLDMKDN